MKNSLTTLTASVGKLLASGRILDTINLLENAALQLSAAQELDRIREIARNYGYLCSYALDGADDPSRNAQLADISASLSHTAEVLRHEQLAAEAPTLYFNTVRTLRLRGERDSLKAKMSQYHDVTGKLALSMLSEAPSDSLRQEAESIEKEIFSIVWTAFPLSRTDAALISDAMADPALPAHFKSLMVGALMMALNERPDETRLELLAGIYESAAEEAVSLRALTALIISLWMHRTAIYSHKFASRMAALTDGNAALTADVRQVVMQIIRTRDTDRVTRKITDEVIPEMMKLRPDIEKKMKSIDPETAMDPEANPEWEEMLEKSGVADSLRELQEMQEDGADVMMSTFGRLKTFPFFNDISNWFMPFHTEHSIISANLKMIPDTLMDMLETSTMFCDNDKFSFLLSMSHVPAGQMSMMVSQLDAAASQMKMMQSEAMADSLQRRGAIIQNFTRDIYRFFKLFRRKGEFADPLDSPINPAKIPFVGPLLSDDRTLTLIGQFYFKYRYWAEAYDILSQRASLFGQTVELLQKIGYSLSRQGLHSQALEYYARAEMLGDDSRWLYRRIASSLRALERHQEALEYLLKLEAEMPDDLKLATSIGQTYMKLKQFDRALKYFYKVDYSEPGKVNRQMAWSTFMTGDHVKSRALYDQILTATPSATDYMNAGHLALVTRDYRHAASLYSKAIAASEFDRNSFMTQFEADRAVLAGKGVDPAMAAIVIDEAFRMAASLGSPR